jgi:DNA polymerase-3 subunit beta
MFQTERALIHTKLVEGRFPPYRDIIPKKSTIKVTLNPAEFLSRVRQAAIMTDEATKRVDFEFGKQKLLLKAEGAETGSSEVRLDLPDYDGDEITIAFDPQYLVEMLRAIEGETSISLEMTSGEKPAVFRAGDNYLYLVMPLAG